MQNWKIINEDYLNYLRNIEPRIPFTDYGADKFKPFFGVLFEKDGLFYVTQITSPKQRHFKLKKSLDLIKIYSPVDTKKLITVINLNYMFPVPGEYLYNLEYSLIDKYRTFVSDYQKSQYISFLRLQLREINKINIEPKAYKLYNLRLTKPEHVISKRCFDFSALEEAAKQYNK